VLDSLLPTEPSNLARSASIGCYLGSFDPPHRGHLALARALLEEVDEVLLLIPTMHFHKTPTYPSNATFDQRLQMLEAVRTMAPGKIHLGLTDVVLFLELDARLRRRYPGALVVFAMGDETFAKLSGSAEYFRRVGRTWDRAQERSLIDLQSRCHVWNRSGASPLARQMTATLSGISSTRVRNAVGQLWCSNAADAAWSRVLHPMVPAAVIEDVRRFGLYRAHGPVHAACRV
jgi:cytidyltransferase-like protein